MVAKAKERSDGLSVFDDPEPGCDWDHWKQRREYDLLFSKYTKAKPGSDLARYLLWWLAKLPTC